MRSAIIVFECKKSVAALYETDTIASLLKDCLHPGGLALTQRLSQLADLKPSSRALDIGCGEAAGLLLLAETIGCSMVGIDMSGKKISSARSRASCSSLDHLTAFALSDAELLPFKDGSFDAIVSECSFSLLPQKESAVREMYRVMKKGGALAIADVARPRNECQNGYELLPCMTGASSVEEYIDLFEAAGFTEPYVEDHSRELKRVGYRVGMKFGSWNNFMSTLTSELNDFCRDNLRDGKKVLPPWKFSYVLIRVAKA